MVDKMISADKELNGAQFDDVFKQFSYPQAQELQETREKFYLKTLQSISSCLDPTDPQFEIMEKAVHTIAAEYIKNRKYADIVMEELAGFEEQMILLETDLIGHQNEIEKLLKAREDDKALAEGMLAEI